MAESFTIWFRGWLSTQGMSGAAVVWLGRLGAALVLILLAFVANWLTKRILLAVVSGVIRRSPTHWDDVMLERGVFTRLSHIAPALIIYFGAGAFPELQDTIQRISLVYMMLAGLSVGHAFLDGVEDIYRGYEVSRQKPIKGYLQIVKIVLTIFVLVAAIAFLLGRSPWLMLSGLGAMTAILLLVFKDTILGLVASVQLSSNDMVRIGDWISMPKYGADGDVIDVTLHTVKVQNWDRTITTIPAYLMVTDSFTNWRGMSESGGRRIKRSVFLDMTSVRFCTGEMLDRFERFQLIRDYVRGRRAQIEEYNREHAIDTSELINGRHMTNLGTFRAYLQAYLKNHPKVHKEMILMVRHLAPGPTGIPIEIYFFSNDQDWVNYEGIQADIFDHVLAVVPVFGLRVFQNPSGHDVQELSGLARK